MDEQRVGTVVYCATSSVLHDLHAAAHQLALRLHLLLHSLRAEEVDLARVALALVPDPLVSLAVEPPRVFIPIV